MVIAAHSCSLGGSCTPSSGVQRTQRFLSLLASRTNPHWFVGRFFAGLRRVDRHLLLRTQEAGRTSLFWGLEWRRSYTGARACIALYCVPLTSPSRSCYKPLRRLYESNLHSTRRRPCCACVTPFLSSACSETCTSSNASRPRRQCASALSALCRDA